MIGCRADCGILKDKPIVIPINKIVAQGRPKYGIAGNQKEPYRYGYPDRFHMRLKLL